MHGSENDDTVAYVVVPDSSQMHVRAQVQMLSHGSLNLCLEITSTAICDEKNEGKKLGSILQHLDHALRGDVLVISATGALIVNQILNFNN